MTRAATLDLIDRPTGVDAIAQEVAAEHIEWCLRDGRSFLDIAQEVTGYRPRRMMHGALLMSLADRWKCLQEGQRFDD